MKELEKTLTTKLKLWRYFFPIILASSSFNLKIKKSYQNLLYVPEFLKERIALARKGEKIVLEFSLIWRRNIKWSLSQSKTTKSIVTWVQDLLLNFTGNTICFPLQSLLLSPAFLWLFFFYFEWRVPIIPSIQSKVDLVSTLGRMGNILNL